MIMLYLKVSKVFAISSVYIILGWLVFSSKIIYIFNCKDYFYYLFIVYFCNTNILFELHYFIIILIIILKQTTYLKIVLYK